MSIKITEVTAGSTYAASTETPALSGIHTQHMIVCDPAGNPILPLTDDNLRDSPVPVDAGAVELDYDTGAGNNTVSCWGLLLPANGGPVPVSSTNPLPVSGTMAVSGTATITGAVTGSGTFSDQHVSASADYDTGAGTQALSMYGLAIPASGGAVPVGAANPLPVQGPLTDAQLRATAVPISGTTTVVPSGTQTITGTVTANAGTGTYTITGAVTGPLTDTQLRAAPVPVSGPLTDTQLRATAVPISGTATMVPSGTQTVTGDVTANAGTGTFAVSAAALPLPSGAATETTLAAVAKEGAAITGATMPAGGSSVLGWLSAIWQRLTDRLPAALTAGGNIKVALQETGVTQAVSGTLSVTGSSVAVTGTLPVTGTFWQATQPVSGTLAVTQGAGTWAALPGQVSAAARTSVAASTSSVTLLAANASRRGAIFYNGADKTCYLTYGATASATDFTVPVEPGDTWVMADLAYTGAVSGIWAAGVNTALKMYNTEL